MARKTLPWSRLALLALACFAVGSSVKRTALAETIPPRPLVHHDFDGDGVAEFVEVIIDAEAGSGLTRIVDSGDGSLLHELIASEAGQFFGLAVVPSGDLDGDGVGDILVSSPALGLADDRVGRVLVYSGATNQLLTTVFGNMGERFGFNPRPAGDFNHDGFGDVAVDGYTPNDEGAADGVSRAVYSGSTGRRVSERWEPLTQASAASHSINTLRQDLNRDGIVAADDLAILLGSFGREACCGDPVDLDGDGWVSRTDLGILLGAFGEQAQGRDIVATPSNYLPLPLDYCWVFPCDPACGMCGGPSDDPEDPNALPSGTGPPTSGGPTEGGEGAICTLDLSYLPRVVVGATSHVSAVVDPPGGTVTWTVLEGAELLSSHGQLPTDPFRYQFTVDPNASALPGLVTIAAEYTTADGCYRTDSCSIEVDACFTGMGGCPPLEALFDEAYTLSGYTLPEGGVLTWEILEGTELVDLETGTPGTFRFRTLGTPGSVRIRLAGDIDGCASEWICDFSIVASFNNDADNDGLNDAAEISYGTDPLNPDTDGDGWDDACEAYNDLGPLDPTRPTLEDIRSVTGFDTDFDGLPDVIERCFGSSQFDYDSDDDGIGDGFEAEHGFDPTDADEDGNDVRDGADDADGDGLPNEREERHGSDPNNADTDGDGTDDGTEVDHGGYPTDPSDGGEEPSDDQRVVVNLTIGDFSGSHSEEWMMFVGDLRLAAPLGETLTERFPLPRGSEHEIRVQHIRTKLEEGPDYDYLANVATAPGERGCIILEDPDGLLGYHSESTFNFAQGKTATLIIPDLGLITMTPDPETHTTSDKVTILPSDVETVEVEFDQSAFSEITLAMSRPDVAAFLDQNGSAQSEIVLTNSPATLEVVGLKTGEGAIQLVGEGLEGACELPILVGGSVTVSLDGPATFKTGYSAVNPPPPALQSDAITPDGPLPPGGSPAVVGGVISDAPDARRGVPADILEQANQLPERPSTATITVLDAEGNPKPGKSFRVVSQNGFLESGGGDSFTTDDQGRALVELRLSDLYNPAAQGVPEQFWSFDRERIALITERAFQEILDESGALAPDHSIWTDQIPERRRLTGASIEYTESFTENEVVRRTVITFTAPMFNHGDFIALKFQLEERLYVHRDPETGAPLSLDGQVVMLLNVETGEMEPVTLQDAPPLLQDSLTAQFLRSTLEGAIGDWPDTTPPREIDLFGDGGDMGGGGLEPVTVAMITAEIALSFVPGWDGVELTKELIWKPLFADESTDWFNASISFAGLAADAGYLAGVAGGLPLNAATSVAKAVIKYVPRPVVIAIMKSGGTALASIKALLRYVTKYPRAAEQALSDWAAEAATSAINQIRRIVRSPLSLGGDEVVAAMRVVNKHAGRSYSDEAAEGIAAYAKHAQGGEAAIDDLFARIYSGAIDDVALAAADDAVESVAEAIQKTLRRNASGGAPDPTDLRRVEEAVAAARRSLDSNYRSTIGAFVGPGHAIKSMEEFEALRFMRAEDLGSEQVIAMRTIREALGGVSEGTRVAKTLPLTGEFNAIEMIMTGNPNLAGSFARASDMFDATTTPQLIDRLRLDAPPFHFQQGSPHAILETTANPGIAANATIPRKGLFRGHALDDPNPPDWDYPFTGNGFTASRDGRIVPEFRTAGGGPAQMPAGTTGAGEATTTLRFRFNDGTPYPQTISVDGVQTTASDWKLIVHPSDPDRFLWVPQ